MNGDLRCDYCILQSLAIRRGSKAYGLSRATGLLNSRRALAFSNTPRESRHPPFQAPEISRFTPLSFRCPPSEPPFESDVTRNKQLWPFRRPRPEKSGEPHGSIPHRILVHPGPLFRRVEVVRRLHKLQQSCARPVVGCQTALNLHPRQQVSHIGIENRAPGSIRRATCHSPWE